MVARLGNALRGRVPRLGLAGASLALAVVAAGTQPASARVAPVSASPTEIRVRFRSGGEGLYGILTLPSGAGPHAAVVLLSGSERRGVELPVVRRARPNARPKRGRRPARRPTRRRPLDGRAPVRDARRQGAGGALRRRLSPLPPRDREEPGRAVGGQPGRLGHPPGGSAVAARGVRRVRLGLGRVGGRAAGVQRRGAERRGRLLAARAGQSRRVRPDARRLAAHPALLPRGEPRAAPPPRAGPVADVRHARLRAWPHHPRGEPRARDRDPEVDP